MSYTLNPQSNPTHPEIVDNDTPHLYVESAPATPDVRPATQRMDALVVGMPGQRDVLLAVLRGCEQVQSDDDVVAMVANAQATNKSVYEALNLCRLLEEAGGLRHVLEDGSEYVAAGPIEYEEDGVAYVQAAEPPRSCWVTTPEGLAYTAADDPAGRTRAVLENETQYAPVFKYVLAACVGQGATTKDLACVVDDNELVQSPRLYVQHFLKELEDAGALVWRDAWVTTPTGEDVLASMDEVRAIAAL